MTDDEDDMQIATRLQAEPIRNANKMSATALVRKHYDTIAAAWQTARHQGKTWEEIGQDLRPANPVAGGTVGRAFARVTSERAKADPMGTVSRTETEPATSSAAATPGGTDNLQVVRRNPFARAIDPIRAEGSN